MKNKISLLLFLLSVTTLFAQNVQTVKTNWTIVTETNQVRVSKRTIQLDDIKNGMHREYVQFKYQNKTAHQLFVSWFYDATYQGSIKTKLDDENYRAFLLDPNQTFVPDFSIQKEKMFFVFKRLTDMPNKPQLVSVELQKLKTNIVKQ